MWNTWDAELWPCNDQFDLNSITSFYLHWKLRGLSLSPVQRTALTAGLRDMELLLRSGEVIHSRDGGGIILALAPAYSPFTAAYFRAPRCSYEFSRESEVETQSSVGVLIFSPTRSITNTCLICLIPVNKAARSCGENYLQLISTYGKMAARITPPHTRNTEHHIIGRGGGGCCCFCCCR